MRQDKVVGAKYVNLEDMGIYARVGDILELIHDDYSMQPKFRNLSNCKDLYRSMDRVAMLAEEEETEVVPVPHKFTVGDKVKVVETESNEYFETSCTGEIATVTDLQTAGGNTHYNGNQECTPAYYVLTERGVPQNLTENQMEKVAEHISDEEYAAIEIGDTVVLREDLVGGQYYGRNICATSMELVRGEEFIVRGDIGHKMGILLEGNTWSWTQQMIAKVIPAKKHITEEEFATLESGDKFISRKDLECGMVFGSLFVSEDMEDNAGATLTVNFIAKDGDVKSVDGGWYYNHEMIAKVIKQEKQLPKHKYAVGQWLYITEDQPNFAILSMGDKVQVVAVGEFGYNVREEGDSELEWAVDESHLSTENPLEQKYDNPELIAGQVYFAHKRFGDYDYVFRFKTESSHLGTGVYSVLFEDSVFHEHVYLSPIHYRKATPAEVAKLEAAEKENGAAVPLINAKGTVIEEGKYYVINSSEGDSYIIKVDGVDTLSATFRKGDFKVSTSGDVTPTVVAYTHLTSFYGKSAVPATQEQIELYDSAIAFEEALKKLAS